MDAPNLPEPTTISQPGIYDAIPMADYVADPCPDPSLSAGGIKRLLDQSPLHAHSAHPRLGGHTGGATVRSDIGSATHTASLGGETIAYCDVVCGDKTKTPGEIVRDWKTKDAQAWQVDQRAAHRIPLLEHQREHIEATASRVRETLERAGHAGDHVKNEQTVIAKVGDVWIKTRPDVLNFETREIVDLKSAVDANPHAWIKRVLFSSGYYTGAALYERAMQEITGEEWSYRWLAQEFDHPYAPSWHALDPQAEDIAQARVQRAIELWGQCLALDTWPGYTEQLHYAEAPAWIVYDHEEREVSAEALAKELRAMRAKRGDA